MDDVFKALADPGRRMLLDSLNAHNGQTLHELTGALAMTRQSVSKHLGILEGAGLITTIRRGREKLHYLNAAPITEIADRWITRYDRQRADALSDLKKALEGTVMATRPDFVYTTYIRAAPEQVWRGLTEPAFTRRYWVGVELDSQWSKGSAVTYRFANGLTIADEEQVVLVSEPYRRLSYTWHSFTQDWANESGCSAGEFAEFAAEPRSKVTFDLEDTGDGVTRLTVVHDDFTGGGVVQRNVSQGWPRILADLKTLLETGQV